ncbi:Transglycosylase SLT domain protein (plasmid) [Rickettsia tamurae subsp. buchneri]|uniref:Transglycosylase SLT domain protein n=2 Tax=Rickettsia TaxID=780 RepID=A0A8E1BZA5_9RICK|nr:Transglycosylase SLT domain protein [Rickettsia tamurae subsp. buchneri]
MTDQTLRLNKIEIGQFLKMKNKVGIPNNNGTKMSMLIRSETLYLSSKRPVKIIEPIVLTITKKAMGRSFGTFNSRPSLLTKISSLTKFTLEQERTISGTVINVIKNTASAKYEKPCPELALGARKKDTKVPTDIPSQKIRFQKLSLLIGFLKILYCFLFSSISYLKVKYHTYMLPCLVRSCKLIRYFLVYFLITLGAQTCLASDMPQLIQKIEKEHAIPSGLLSAIASVESGLKPYAIGVSGKSVKASSKEEAKEIIKEYLAKGITNIDIGIMQINWRWHAGEFDQNLDNMLNPSQNVMYAAQLLKSLHAKHHSWQKAVRHYHSAKDEYHRKYSKAVLVSWLKQI